MTREEILKEYTVDEAGCITTPGKFEGEMLYAPYFYEAVMDGCGEDVYDQDGEEYEESSLLYTRLDIHPEDRTEFPELDPTTTEVLVYPSDQGFVHVEEV